MAKRTTPGRPLGQYTQAVRLFQLYHRLESSPEGVRIEDLARELDVTPRSIRRDLRALVAAQMEIEPVDVAGERRVRLARTGRTSEPIRMTRFQRYSLAAVRRVFDVLAGTPFYDDLTQVFAKLVPSEPTPPEGVALADRFLYIPEAPKNYRRFKDQIYEIYDGVLRNLTLSFQYEGGQAPGARKIEPYALILYRNGLYVVGRDLSRKAYRTFAIERMRRVRSHPNAPFQRDPKFDVSKLFDGAFGIISGSEQRHVVVDFEARVATFIEEREWHPSQTVTRTSTGVRASFDVAITEELVAWVLRWGASARVLEPPELVERVLAEYRTAADAYTRAPSEPLEPSANEAPPAENPAV